MKLIGLAAIDIAEANGLPLNKYNDPIEDARTGLDIAEARKVAAADPASFTSTSNAWAGNRRGNLSRRRMVSTSLTTSATSAPGNTLVSRR